MKNVSRIAAALMATAAISTGLSAGVAAAAPSGNISIYPNISDSHCGWGGRVATVQIAAMPGNSKNWTSGRWVELKVPQGQRIQIVANVQCITWSKNSVYKVVTGVIPSAQANKTYWI